MEQTDLQDIRRELKRLARVTRRLRTALALTLVVLTAAVAALIARGLVRPEIPADRILTLRGLAIVDARGVERVRIQAPLPDPLILGKRFPRGGPVSGVILSDDEGNERSGYVTSDGYPNVFFTLDSLARQHVLFITEPQGDPTLRLWDGTSAATLSAGPEGPRLKLTSGEKILADLPITEPEAKDRRRP